MTRTSSRASIPPRVSLPAGAPPPQRREIVPLKEGDFVPEERENRARARTPTREDLERRAAEPDRAVQARAFLEAETFIRASKRVQEGTPVSLRDGVKLWSSPTESAEKAGEMGGFGVPPEFRGNDREQVKLDLLRETGTSESGARSRWEELHKFAQAAAPWHDWARGAHYRLGLENLEDRKLFLRAIEHHFTSESKARWDDWKLSYEWYPKFDGELSTADFALASPDAATIMLDVVDAELGQAGLAAQG